MKKQLHVRFHGRVIEHLGLQLYQKTEAALGEMIANAWDADAENVHINFTKDQNGVIEKIEIIDDGVGMAFTECDSKFLYIGYSKRGKLPVHKTKKKKRTSLGRKGIGKLAGFGIAKTMTVKTIAESDGELTKFTLRIDELLAGEYVNPEKPFDVDTYLKPNHDRIEKHGTKITLTELVNPDSINVDRIMTNISRRFLLHQQTNDFKIFVNKQKLPKAINPSDVEYLLPLPTDDNKNNIDAEGWCTEQVDGHQVKWRFYFFEETIQEDELRGVSVFAGGKLVQAPFNFNLSGGISGQHGLEYLYGQVQADYLDSLSVDVISPERQRVNWEHPEVQPLLVWGLAKVKSTTAKWKQLRAAGRRAELESRVSGFKDRLSKLQPHERKTVESALLKLAEIPTLSQLRFRELGNSFLTAWEKGRLHDLIFSIGELENPDAAQLVEILTEAEILANLQLAEVVRTKIDAIKALRKQVEERDLENNLRDHIADCPYLLSPEYDTFQRERGVKGLMTECATKAGLDDVEYKGRIDLALRSGESLLIVEFIRPGKELDWDHMSRCVRYVSIIRERIDTLTSLGIQTVKGLIVADHIKMEDGVVGGIANFKGSGIYASDWKSLLDKAEKQWADFFEIIVDRSPKDPRIDELQDSVEAIVKGS